MRKYLCIKNFIRFCNFASINWMVRQKLICLRIQIGKSIEFTNGKSPSEQYQNLFSTLKGTIVELGSLSCWINEIFVIVSQNVDRLDEISCKIYSSVLNYLFHRLKNTEKWYEEHKGSCMIRWLSLDIRLMESKRCVHCW